LVEFSTLKIKSFLFRKKVLFLSLVDGTTFYIKQDLFVYFLKKKMKNLTLNRKLFL